MRWFFGSGRLVMPDALFSSLFCAILAMVVLAQVFRAGVITSQRIQGAVAVYLLFGLAWAFSYQLIDLYWPGAFAQPTLAAAAAQSDGIARFVYFSFVTLTTCGYGDVTPLHPIARSLVTLEVLTGQLFPSILLARLVSMELLHRQAELLEHQ